MGKRGFPSNLRLPNFVLVKGNNCSVKGALKVLADDGAGSGT